MRLSAYHRQCVRRGQATQGMIYTPTMRPALGTVVGVWAKLNKLVVNSVGHESFVVVWRYDIKRGPSTTTLTHISVTSSNAVNQWV